MIRSVASRRRARRRPMRTGSPTTATCATPHAKCGLRPFVRMRCVPHSPTGTTGTPDCLREPRRSRLARASARGPRRSCPRGTPRRTRRARSASTAAESAPAASAVPRYTGNLVRGAQQRAEHRASRTARPWRGTGCDGRAGRPPTPASAGRDTRRDCSRGSPGRASGCSPRPRSSSASPQRNQGQNTPFAAEYTGSTVGSIRSPCRVDPKTTRASSSRCGRSPRARRASPRRSPSDEREALARVDGRARRRRGRRPPGRDRVERARGRRLGAERASCDVRRRSRLARRRGRAPAATWAAGRGLSRVRRRARRSPARPLARRGRRRRRRTRSPCIVPDHRDDGTPVLVAPDRGAVHVRVRTRLGRAPRRRGPAPVARPSGSSATPRSASTSTSPPTSTALERAPTPRRDARAVTRHASTSRSRARALAIGAHADDIEFGCGATLAKWADGRHRRCTLCICTDGSKGTWDGDADLAALIAQREDEQRDAAASPRRASTSCSCATSTASSTAAREPRAAVCRVIREARPDVVLGHDPWQPYRIHPDHLPRRACSSRRASSRRATRTSSPSKASRRTGPTTLLLLRAGPGRSRRERRRLRRPQDRRAARAPQPVALDDGDRRPARRPARRVRGEAARRGARRRAPRRAARRRGVRPHRRPLATRSQRRPGREERTRLPGPFFETTASEVISSSRCACASCDAPHAWPAPSSRPCAWSPCAWPEPSSWPPCAWPEPSSWPPCA